MFHCLFLDVSLPSSTLKKTVHRSQQASAYPLFGDTGWPAVVENVVVEFGPPGRWPTAGDSVPDGLAVLEHMVRHCLCIVCSTAFVAKTPPLLCGPQGHLGFQTRLIDSQVWNQYKNAVKKSNLPVSAEWGQTDFGGDDYGRSVSTWITIKDQGMVRHSMDYTKTQWPKLTSKCGATRYLSIKWP